MVEDSVEKLSRASFLTPQEGIHTVVYHALEHVTIDRIKMSMLRETMYKHVVEYLKPSKAVGVHGKRLLRRDRPPAPIASFV